MTQPSEKRPWYRRLVFRISLRALFVLVLLIGCLLGWVRSISRTQREIVAAVEKAGGSVVYDLKSNTLGNVASQYCPGWLVKLLGDDFFWNVTTISDGGGKGLDDETLEKIGQLKSLECLWLASTQLSDRGLSHLIRLKDFKTFCFNGSDLSGKGLANLSKMTQLEMLEIHGGRFSDDDLRVLSSLESMRSLELFLDPDSPITEASLNHLANMKKLVVLTLGSTVTPSYSPLRLGREGMSLIAAHKNLLSLDLHGTLPTDLEPLRGHPSLGTLILAGKQLDDSTLAPLAQIDPLQVLSLVDNKAMTDKTVALLKGRPYLQVLYLEGTRISDEALHHIADYPILRCLYIQQTEVTDAALSPLRKNQNLQFIQLKGTKVTAAGVKKAIASHPTRLIIEGP